MRFTFISMLLLSLTAIGAGQTASVDYGKLSSLLESIVQEIPTSIRGAIVPTKTVNLDNIAGAPPNFVPVIMTAVPLSVLGDLIDPYARSSLASEFKAGTTPGWYQSLPPSIKSYLSTVHTQIADGALSANTSAPLPTSTSTARAAALANPTGAALKINMAGALGVAAVALVL